MTLRLSIVASIIALALLVVILELIRSRRLQERYAILWLVTGGAILVLSVWRSALGEISDVVGIAFAHHAFRPRLALHPGRAAPLFDRDLTAVRPEPDPRPEARPTRERTRHSSWRLTARWTAPHLCGGSTACGPAPGAPARARGPMLLAFVVRMWLNARVDAPWIMADELIHSEMAKSFADGDGLDIRGRPPTPARSIPS